MKKIIALYAVLVLALIALAFFKAGRFNFTRSAGASVTINSTTYNVNVADEESERIQGLSGKDKLDENEGLLFVFPEKARTQFWMKDMKFPIDIIFIDDNRVVDVVENAPPPSETNPALPIYAPDAPANYVLEVNAGEASKKNIKAGDTVTFQRVNAK